MQRPTRPDLWSRAVDAWFRSTGSHQAFRCPQCDFDLRGSPAPGGFFRCPECGTETARYRAMTRPRIGSWWNRWAGAVLLGSLLVLYLVLAQIADMLL